MNLSAIAKPLRANIKKRTRYFSLTKRKTNTILLLRKDIAYMKNLFTLFFTLSLLLAAGCAATSQKINDDKAAPQKFTEKDIAAGKELSEKYINALVLSVQKKDFNIIAPYLQVDMLSIRQKKSIFNEMCKRFSLNGKITSYSFAEVIDQTLCRDYIWKINFEKNTSSAQLPVIKTTMLYSIRIVISDGKPEIIRARPIQL